jgi:hypothetical protein
MSVCMIAHLIKPVVRSPEARARLRGSAGGLRFGHARNQSKVPTNKPVFTIRPIPLDELERQVGIPHDPNLDEATRWSRYRTKVVDEVHHQVIESRKERSTREERVITNAVGRPDEIWEEVDRLRASALRQPQSRVRTPRFILQNS